MLNERALSWYTDTKARERDEKQNKDARIKGAIMKHGKKRYKDFVDSEGKKKKTCLLYTSPSPRDPNRSRMPSSA